VRSHQPTRRMYDMAYFAEIDSNKIVIRVIVADDKYDNEEGSDWCKDFFGGGTWVRTAMDGSIRANYAGVGWSYDDVNDVFIAPKPFPSFVLDTDTFRWESPVEHPNDGVNRYWDEDSLTWKAVAP